MKKNKRLGDAELEIMMTIWDAKSSLTSVQIREKLDSNRGWAMSTLMTSLSRMVDKGFLTCDKSTGINVYTPLVEEADYKLQESQSFLEKMYGNSFPSMITTLYNKKAINESDIEELRNLLNTLEGGKEK